MCLRSNRNVGSRERSKTGKLIRVSDLSMMVEELDGNFIAINKLTEEEQWEKLKLVKEIAEEVWRSECL